MTIHQKYNRPALAAFVKLFSILLLVSVFSACSSVYYNTLEKFGVHKRDLLVDRVEDVNKSQEEAQEEFVDALQKFKSVVKVEPSKLESTYDRINDAYEASDAAAKEIRERIDSVEEVAEDLFREWNEELGQYSDQKLKSASQKQLRATKARYGKMLSAMKVSRSKLDPPLRLMKDQVLFLKHNLNAKSIGAIENEVTVIDRRVKDLISSMEASIKESRKFIKSIEG